MNVSSKGNRGGISECRLVQQLPLNKDRSVLAVFCRHTSRHFCRSAAAVFASAASRGCHNFPFSPFRTKPLGEYLMRLGIGGERRKRKRGRQWGSLSRSLAEVWVLENEPPKRKRKEKFRFSGRRVLGGRRRNR